MNFELKEMGKHAIHNNSFFCLNFSRGDSQQAAILEEFEGYFHALYEKMSHKTVN